MSHPNAILIKHYLKNLLRSLDEIAAEKKKREPKQKVTNPQQDGNPANGGEIIGDVMKKETLARLLRSRKFRAWRPRHVEHIRYKVTAKEETKPGGIVELYTEQHYTPAQLGASWGVDAETIRNLFRNEPGVLKIGKNGAKRSYISLRIPESVAARVHHRLSA